MVVFLCCGDKDESLGWVLKNILRKLGILGDVDLGIVILSKWKGLIEILNLVLIRVWGVVFIWEEMVNFFWRKIYFLGFL